MELQSNETILWSGKPKQGVCFSSRDAFLIPFSMVWCGFAIFWTISATKSGAPAFFTIFGLGFVCVGLFFVFGRFFYDSVRRSQTEYHVTNMRVIICKSGSEVSIPIGQWTCLRMEKHSDQTGTIQFGESSRSFGFHMDLWMPSSSNIPCFFKIHAPDEIMSILSTLSDKKS
jgi:hypothetical protein